ncbi:TetR/AcrR family transcriptional regulator [Cohnella cholangitidis]|uniref:TetR/AcrR family transcriptional regulator n=1 Tax=Cohnella cholangitidis TaxID=2598458 RepID=A0A7G5C154_9BACL|nr:TetR/AcrR family transcriptional regulator [Cohnella cholangitidis]QMV42938.1 TetR/AcrR family transcriptional regulator [Cohnella cholangitidis]
MQDKKKQILEAAIHCFARKGFNATTIQEIVDELGMAKGSIYFYFKSKDDLLISVIEYYSQMLFERMEGLPDEAGLPPREKLELQWERQFRFIREHLDFMMTLIKEPITGLHPHIQGMMIRLRARSQVWNVSHLLAIYGSPVENYLADASALMSGIVAQYLEAIMFEKKSFDDAQLSRFLLRRLDDLIAGMIQAGEPQILPPMNLDHLRTLAGLTPAISNSNTVLIQEIMDRIVGSESPRDESVQRDMMAALALLKDEIVKPAHKNHLIIRAMLALLKQHASDELMEPLLRLEQSLLENPI